MIQLALYLPAPRARRRDPATSHAAAASMREAASAQAGAVLAALRSLGVAGAEQIGAVCGLNAYAVRKRTSELYRAGLIELTGATRRTASGRQERVWRAI